MIAKNIMERDFHPYHEGWTEDKSLVYSLSGEPWVQGERKKVIVQSNLPDLMAEYEIIHFVYHAGFTNEITGEHVYVFKYRTGKVLWVYSTPPNAIRLSSYSEEKHNFLKEYALQEYREARKPEDAAYQLAKYYERKAAKQSNI